MLRPFMRLIGSLLVILAAACFGFMGLFGSWVTGSGVSVEMMLFLRFAIAGAVMTIIMFIRRERWPRGKLLMGLIGMGGILYVGEAMFWFHSARFIPAGMTSLLLYVYPVIVTLFAWLFLKEKLTRPRMMALVLACLGLVLTIGPAIARQRSGSSEAGTDQTLIGVILGLLCCLSYAVYILCGGGLVKKAGAIPSATVVILSAAAVLGTTALARGDAFPTFGGASGGGGGGAWSGIICLAVFSTLIAITAVLYGLHVIGPVQTSTLSTLEPVVTVLVGWMFMGERLSMVQAIGGALIVAAAVVVARSSTGESPPQHFSTDVAEIH